MSGSYVDEDEEVDILTCSTQPPLIDVAGYKVVVSEPVSSKRKLSSPPASDDLSNLSYAELLKLVIQLNQKNDEQTKLLDQLTRKKYVFAFANNKHLTCLAGTCSI